MRLSKAVDAARLAERHACGSAQDVQFPVNGIPAASRARRLLRLRPSTQCWPCVVYESISVSIVSNIDAYAARASQSTRWSQRSIRARTLTVSNCLVHACSYATPTKRTCTSILAWSFRTIARTRRWHRGTAFLICRRGQRRLQNVHIFMSGKHRTSVHASLLRIGERAVKSVELRLSDHRNKNLARSLQPVSSTLGRHAKPRRAPPSLTPYGRRSSFVMSRVMFFSCASTVPPPISSSLASRHRRSTAYSPQ